LKVYLDTSALNRIFDDQSQGRIYLEATAMQLVFLLIANATLELVSSEALVFETERNPFPERQFFVNQVLQRASGFQPIDSEVVAQAEQIEKTDRIKGVDALHLACAEAAGVDYFVTCDDRLIRRYSGQVAIKTPTEFAVLLMNS
jgi:predicted nucleic acid-binding protein